MSRGFLTVVLAFLAVVILHIVHARPDVVGLAVTILAFIVADEVSGRSFRFRDLPVLIAGAALLTWLLGRPALNTSEAIAVEWTLIAAMIAVGATQAIRRTR